MMERIHDDLKTYESNKAKMGYKFLEKTKNRIESPDLSDDEDYSQMTPEQKGPADVLKELVKKREAKEKEL